MLIKDLIDILNSIVRYDPEYSNKEVLLKEPSTGDLYKVVDYTYRERNYFVIEGIYQKEKFK